MGKVRRRSISDGLRLQTFAHKGPVATVLRLFWRGHLRRKLMRLIRIVAFVFQILIGGLLFRPDGVLCTKCEILTIGQVLGVVSIVLGVIGLINEFRAPAARG